MEEIENAGYSAQRSAAAMNVLLGVLGNLILPSIGGGLIFVAMFDVSRLSNLQSWIARQWTGSKRRDAFIRYWFQKWAYLKLAIHIFLYWITALVFVRITGVDDVQSAYLLLSLVPWFLLLGTPLLNLWNRVESRVWQPNDHERAVHGDVTIAAKKQHVRFAATAIATWPVFAGTLVGVRPALSIIALIVTLTSLHIGANPLRELRLVGVYVRLLAFAMGVCIGLVGLAIGLPRLSYLEALISPTS